MTNSQVKDAVEWFKNTECGCDYKKGVIKLLESHLQEVNLEEVLPKELELCKELCKHRECKERTIYNQAISDIRTAMKPYRLIRRVG